MTIDAAIREWKSKDRRMGCVSASLWFCKRVKGFQCVRIQRYNELGDLYEHVVATDDTVQIDLAPYTDKSD